VHHADRAYRKLSIYATFAPFAGARYQSVLKTRVRVVKNVASVTFRFLQQNSKTIFLLGFALLIIQIAPGYSGTDENEDTPWTREFSAITSEEFQTPTPVAVKSMEEAAPERPSLDAGRVHAPVEEERQVAKVEQSAPVEKPAQSLSLEVEDQAPTFDIASVEKLRLRVWGYSDMNGEYAIAPDMTMSVAGLGRIRVGNITPSALEDYLSEKLSDFTRREIRVSVEVARYRPYFITGHIARPGAIEWRPGLTLIQAISLGGGLSRSTTSADPSGRSQVLDQGNIRLLKQTRTRRKFALAQLARFKAEKEGLDSVEQTGLLDTLLGSEAPDGRRSKVETFIASQNALLKEQRGLMQSRIAGLEREKEASLRELEAAQTQEKAIHRRLKISQKQLKSLQRLQKKRLVANTRYLAQRSALIDDEVRHSQSLSLLARARARVSAIARQISTIKLERRALLNDRIENLEREVAQFELTFSEFKRTSNLSGSLNIEETAPPAIDYHIARKDKTGVKTITATLFTEILPGDVVIISSSPHRRMRSAATGATESTTATRSALDRTQELFEATVAVRTTPASLAVSPLIGSRAGHN